MDHNPVRCGHVGIIGLPNAGKSSLMNALVGERLSIVTHKAQTTRQRIPAIINEPNCQIILFDTPGWIEREMHQLHATMQRRILETLTDVDLLLYIEDIASKHPRNPKFVELLQATTTPKLILLNKMDLCSPEVVEARVAETNLLFPNTETWAISVRTQFGTQKLKKRIQELLPLHPRLYDENALTTLPLRFFASEMIREKIFILCEEEIPYSTQVEIVQYEETPDIDRIHATIYTTRNTQKAILIGKGGRQIKAIGTQARKAIERFLGKRVYLQLFVKVAPDWRNRKGMLRHFGYEP